jgi:hypothetical protein
MCQYASLNAAVESLTGDAGVIAYPLGGTIDVLGGLNLNTVGTANTITINLDDNVSITGTFDAVGDVTTSAGDIEATLGNFLAPAGLLSVGLTIDAVGTITSSTGDIVSTLGAGSFATSVTVGNDLHVLAGGADIVGTVEFSDLAAGTMRTSAAGVISALADGNDGTVLIGDTGGVPIWATLTAGANIGIAEAANSITISVTGVVTSVTAGTNINLTGTATDPVVNLDDAITLTTVNATTFETNVAAARLELSGTSLVADGTDANIDLNITSKGTGQVIIDDLQLTTDLAVQYGGTGVSTLTQYGVLIGNAATDIQALAVGATNQVLLGNTGANPSWGAVDITTDITGILPVDNGGTGLNSITDHGVVVGSGAANVTPLAVGATNTVLLGNTGADPSWGAVDLTTDITGILPIANGGTNASSMTNTYGINYFDGTRLVTTAVGTATHVLTSNGVGVAPTFQANSGTNMTIHTDGADATEAANAFTIAGTANEIETSGAGSTVTIGLPNAVTIATLTLTNDLAVTEGGTGAGTFTDHGVLIGSGTAAITPLTVGTNGQVLLGSSAADPVFATITSSDSSISFTAGAGTLSIQGTAASVTQVGSVELTTDAEAINGTDSTRAITSSSLKAKLGTQTSHGLPYGAGTTTAIAWTAEPSDGQILIGDTAAIPQLGTITAGTGITVTNAAHSITVASTGTTLNDQTGTTYTLVLTDAGKFITFTNAAAITVTVPTNAAVAFPIGTQIAFQQGGAGQVTLSGAVPPTLKSADNAYTTVKLYSVGAIVKIASDVWCVAGDMEA